MANELEIMDGARSLVPQSTFEGWYGPNAPIPATAPAGTEPRQFDYTIGRNLTYNPRAFEAIGFKQLRMFADNCYLMRVIIEKMKDRICSKSWHFRLKPEPGEYSAKNKERSNQDPRIARLTSFYERPDSINTFKKWLRMLLEDRIVIDAASLEVQRNRGGGIINLLPIDGAMIDVLIDATGRRPKAPLPAYRQIVHGLPAVDFTASELIYMPANVRTNKLYGFSPVEQTVSLMLLFLYKTVFDQSFYSDSNIPFAQLPIPQDMSVDNAIRLLREVDARLSGDPKERSKILPVMGNGKIELIKQQEFNNKFEEWAARVFCYVVGEPATGFVQQNNRATAQQQDDSREESGEQPMMLWVKDEIDSMVQRPDILNAPDIEFVWDETAETDALVQAQVDQINVTIGTRTADELRARDGLSPLWEESGGNKPAPVAPAGNEDDPEDDDPKDDNKPPNGKKVASKAADGNAQKKTLKIDPAVFTPARRSATDKIDATLKAFFFTERHRVSQIIAPHLQTVQKAAGDSTPPDPDVILQLIDFAAWDALVNQIEPELNATGRDAVAEVFATLEMAQEGGFFDLANTDALEYAQTRAAELVGKKWLNGVLVDNPDAKWAITETTRNDLRDLIGKAFAEEWSPAELAKQIDASFTFSADRAEMIAETETSMALTHATVTTGTEVGATTKSIQMSNLHDIDDECDAAQAAGEVPVESAYPDGSMHTPLHPRCRCVELLHIEKVKEPK